MSFSGLLGKLLAALINTIGPALIELILKWLQGLSPDETKEVARSVAEGIKKINDSTIV